MNVSVGSSIVTKGLTDNGYYSLSAPLTGDSPEDPGAPPHVAIFHRSFTMTSTPAGMAVPLYGTTFLGVSTMPKSTSGPRATNENDSTRASVEWRSVRASPILFCSAQTG